MKTENNEKRCIANQIILDLFYAGETGQIQILMMACHLSLKQLAPQDLRKAAESLLAIIPSKDGERLNFLAQRCYLPGDHPDDGLLVVVSEKYAPLGSFTCNRENDAKALRAAIDKATKEARG